ncbi:hypothetical protein Asera_59710 [Actinocatenispora sera]|uniref:Uncharacterized protein n=1 Tax=Actinocatenispora sera TaxID=390989 RepID=A0A810L9A0_9ACTN|nr:hypothetical protein Asera_59710 [Actinocatenispora sera]
MDTVHPGGTDPAPARAVESGRRGGFVSGVHTNHERRLASSRCGAPTAQPVVLDRKGRNPTRGG